MNNPEPSAPPLTINPVISHWVCLEIDHEDHPLISLCGEPGAMAYTNDPARPPAHMCVICQLLAPHHSENCSGCAVYTRRWEL